MINCTCGKFPASSRRSSLYELLTPQETVEARLRGWDVCHVYLPEKNRWCVSVLSTRERGNSEATKLEVVAMARNTSDKLAIRVLQLIMQSHAPSTKGKK